MSQWTFTPTAKGVKFVGICKDCGTENTVHILEKINSDIRYVSCSKCGRIVEVKKK